jgi:hypothetical protein
MKPSSAICPCGLGTSNSPVDLPAKSHQQHFRHASLAKISIAPRSLLDLRIRMCALIGGEAPLALMRIRQPNVSFTWARRQRSVA